MKFLAALPVLLLSTLVAAGSAMADGRHSVAPVNNTLYKQNCAECHFGYQPGLLPARSWQKLMLPESLADHFGENAEMAEADRVAILSYLTENAGDNTASNRSFRLFRSLKDSQTPLRITELPYIRHEHDEIPNRMITDNKDVLSLSNCNACHTQADAGRFDEKAVHIPNVGYWDD